MTLKTFLQSLRSTAPASNVFNPWRDIDVQNDTGGNAPKIRMRQLRHYLDVRLQSCRYLFIGEALGYQGGHFSGIAMTSERILLGHKRDRGIEPHYVLPNVAPERTSKPELKPNGFSEPTGTIVWETLLKNGLPPRTFVLWNTFAWHPFNPHKGLLSNRKPTNEELRASLTVLKQFLQLFGTASIIAVGKVAAYQLSRMNRPHTEVRHPAQGGASKFRNQTTHILQG
jgi:uracil-DNA glycosylase